MKKPCLDCHKNTAPLSGGGATLSTGVFASRVRRQEWSTAIGADTVAFEISGVVFGLLTCGCGAAGDKEIQNTLGITDGNAGTTICNLGDLMPEVAHPSTCPCREQRVPSGTT